MNNYVKVFFYRGLIFGGFGPIILGIVYLILSLTVEDFSVSGTDVFSGIISTYLIAFIHAGASVFNQIEHWPITKSMLFHFLTLYICYTLAYLINTWIPFVPMVLLIYTAAFVLTYVIIWLIVVAVTKGTQKKLNSKL